jgi:hypothetical protein
MKPDQYRERVVAQLDATRTHEKNRILLGFIEQLFPTGDPDHQVSGAEFIAEGIRLLAAFHPDNLKLSEEKPKPNDEPTESAF